MSAVAGKISRLEVWNLYYVAKENTILDTETVLGDETDVLGDETDDGSIFLETLLGGATYSPVQGRIDVVLELSRGEIDASSMDAGPWAEFLHGRKDVQISFTLRYVEDDAGQAILIENYFDGGEQSIDVRFRLHDSGVWCAGQAFVTNLAPAPSMDDPTAMTGTLRFTGPLQRISS